MEYRKLPHGGELISVIGMGTSVVGEKSQAQATDTITYALDQGVNLFDMAGGHAYNFAAMGDALSGRRSDAMLQVHFGADYTSGAYGWNISLESVKNAIEWIMDKLHTDYLDFGFMHCLDQEPDLDKYKENGVIDYLLDLKSQGVVRHLALSTHTPEIADAVLDMNLIDLIMFSINPMYDYGQGSYAIGQRDERFNLYKRCEKEGVGITVMKPYNAGLLLDEARSPFHHALSTSQCIQYALDRPAVLSVLPGISSKEQLDATLEYLHSAPEERDYSMIGDFTPENTQGICVYCKHCHPCPAGLDIGLINKYYDLALLGDDLAKDHYINMDLTASDCTQCGHCNKRCMFKVPQKDRMQEIAKYFGK